MANRALVLCIVAMLAVACDDAVSTPVDREAIRRPSMRVDVVRDSGRAPETCAPESVGALVVEFFDAVNREDVAAIPGFFAEDFEWYSITEGNPRKGGRHFVARDHQELEEYFSKRATHDERMHLLEITVGYDKARDLGHVVYELLRTADDLDRYGARVHGKGAIQCSTGQIYVWSFGQGKGSGSIGELCPGKADPPRLALACT